MLIYKIFRVPEWADLQKAGQTKGAPIDVADGFIHFSTAAQVAETAARHFAGAEDLVLSAVDTKALGPDLRWEPSRGGQDFPHLYNTLHLSQVVWTKSYRCVDGIHILPEGVT
ncbi:MAG: DUF952 domain-containing protein [Rhodobacteraceae bacterium]|nr:DUF952 domain-containing protein [Paracoccaceae bacterium]